MAARGHGREEEGQTMIEVLEFTFKSFWNFIGVFALIFWIFFCAGMAGAMWIASKGK